MKLPKKLTPDTVSAKIKALIIAYAVLGIIVFMGILAVKEYVDAAVGKENFEIVASIVIFIIPIFILRLLFKLSNLLIHFGGKKKLENKLVIKRNSDYSEAKYDEYINYFYSVDKKRQLIPKLSNKLLIKLILICLYLVFVCFSFMDKNFVLSAAFIAFPFSIYGYKGISVHILKNKKSEEKDNVLASIVISPKKGNIGDIIYRVFVFLSFSVIVLASLTITTIDIVRGNFKSDIASAAIYKIPQVLEKVHITVNPEPFYDVSAYFSNTYILPFVKKGELLEKRGDIAEAEKYYQKCFALNVNDYEGYYLLAKLYISKGEYESALRLLEKGQKKNAYYSPIYCELAKVHLYLNDLKSAMANIEIAISLDSGSYEGYSLKAKILTEQHQYALAQSAIEKAMSLKPNDAELLTQMSECLYLDKKFNGALMYANYALEVSPDDVEANYIKGNILFKQNSFDEAYQVFSKILAKKKDYIKARAAMVMAMNAKGDYAKMEEDMKKLTEKEYMVPEVLYTLAYVEKEKAMYQEALKHIDKAIKVNPNISWYYGLKAEIMFLLNRTDDVKELVNKTIELDKSDETAYYVNALNLFNSNMFEEALKNIDICIDLNSNFARAYGVKALILNAMSDKSKADEFMSKALSLTPQDYYIIYMKAKIMYERKLNNGALESVNQALGKNDRFIYAYLLKANIMQKLGNAPERITAVNKAFEINSSVIDVKLNKLEIDSVVGNVYDAYGTYKEMENMSPGYENIYISEAMWNLKYSNYDEASALIDKAININKDNYLCYAARLSIINNMSGYNALSESIGLLRKIVELNKYNADYYYMLGVYLAQSGNLSEAQDCLVKASECESNFASSTVKKSDIYKELENINRRLGDNFKADDYKRKSERAYKMENLGIPGV